MLHELTAGEAGLLVMLFPHLAGLDLEHAEDLGETVRITARTRTEALACRGKPTAVVRHPSGRLNPIRHGDSGLRQLHRYY